MRISHALAAPLPKLLIACAVLLVLAACATQLRPGEAEVLAARVFRLKGAARWRRDADQPWQEVKAGTRLPLGAMIETGVGSRADICLGRSPKRIRSVVFERPSGRVVGHTTLYDNMIRLWENSRVRFDRVAPERSERGTRPAEDVRLDLSAGHLFGAVPKLAEGSSYEIRFGPCVGRIVGTMYDAAAEGVIKVLSGSVSVTWPGSPKPQVVSEDQMFDARTGVLQAIPHPDRSCFLSEVDPPLIQQAPPSWKHREQP